VDGLSSRALEAALSSLSPEDAEKARKSAENDEHPAMLEMHGRLFDVLCTACGHSELDFSSPICEALRGTEALMDAGVAEPDIPITDLPHCKKCNALGRPGVVWFGERPKYLDTIGTLVEEADLCIVVGTSSTVSKAVSKTADTVDCS
jgi:NAD+-dependent protein deacetylase sirtuin 5